MCFHTNTNMLFVSNIGVPYAMRKNACCCVGSRSVLRGPMLHAAKADAP